MVDQDALIAALAAAVAVALAIAAMFTLRCLHPPSGAVALTAVLGGPAIRDLGFGFVLWPVGVNSVVILTVATARGCEYEREHHRLLGQRAGLTSDEIEGILADTAVDSLSPRERVLRESAQTLVATKDLDDEQHNPGGHRP